jgi:hypothetical protein
MAQPVSTPHEMPVAGLQGRRTVASVVAIAGSVVGALVLLGALVLWFHYGTAVFFEMIAAGISACV